MKAKILGGIMMGAMAASSLAAENRIFTYRVGRFEVYMLVETEGPGNPSILLNPDKAALDAYIPGGTFTSAVNTFLIKTADQIVVVDTGFGGAIFSSLKTLGIDPARVDAVLLTHMHGDHINGLQKDGKALFPNARVCLAQQEKDHWVKPNTPAAAALAPYGDRVATFRPAELGAAAADLLPGIKAIATFGHTPGHTSYLVESEGEQLIIWGDLMHVQPIQFPLPDQSVSFDTDPVAAAAARRQILAYAAKHNAAIGGMHLAYPAIGKVAAEGKGYRFIPCPGEAPRPRK
jgi:glyoxylase-like metal-dependent hydrolase (beta-lactamase superfamily II)